MRPLARFLLTLFLAGAGLAVGGWFLAAQATAVLTASRTTSDPNLLRAGELSLRSVVYARDGSVLAYLHAEENRSPVDLEAVPDHVVNAVLDMEDDRFWSHGGVDLRSTMRALFTDVQEGRVVQGGSTVTQQLVKNALLTPERDVNRKVKEAVLAHRLEDQMSKREILEQYLNTVYFGNGAYGVQAAAETYWDKDVAELTVAEGALLAGIIRNPVGYDPIKNPAVARKRRLVALQEMVEHGHVPPGQVDDLAAEPLPAVRNIAPPPDDYFVEEVKQRLLYDTRLGETAQERYNAVFKGGLAIHTTLDPRMQKAAEEKVNTILPARRGPFTAALTSVEPATGYVRAMVGGPGFDHFKYNIATHHPGRQPGSSWKVFDLVAALEAGYSPHSQVDGTAPCPIPKNKPFGPYSPENYEGSAGAVTTISGATAKSMNCAFLRIGLAVGLEKVVDTAKRMGISTPLDAYAAMTLGSEEVTPLDMASAYATLANDGLRHEPVFVEKLLDRHGEVVFSGPSEGEQVVTTQVARMATQVLRGVVEGGTGVRARVPGWQVAGKTGTSQAHQNAWFVGFTKKQAAAVWMGSPFENLSMFNVGGIRVAGGTYPARIFGGYMAEAMKGTSPVGFTPPDPKQMPRAKPVKENLTTKTPTTVAPTTVPLIESTTIPEFYDPPPSIPEDSPPPTDGRAPPTTREPPPPPPDPDECPDMYYDREERRWRCE